MNSLKFAFVGDAVYTLIVREGLVNNSDAKIGELHKLCSKTVCAKAQSKAFLEIYSKLSEVEKEVADRARNAKHNTVPKTCTLEEYRNATSFEAVLGYNFLNGNTERIKEIISWRENGF